MAYFTIKVTIKRKILLRDLLTWIQKRKFSEWLTSGTYVGDRPVNFTNVRNLYIHLEQINTSSTFVNGAPSNLLTTIGVGGHKFGDINTFKIKHPEFKCLQNGTIAQLKISVKDTNNHTIDTSLPISVTLEIE